MNTVLRAIVIASTLLGAGCAHQINITPPLNTLQAGETVKISKNVGYHIAPADLDKLVSTPGGGGDKVSYHPYKESEPALQQVLANLFAEVVAVPALDDKALIESKQVAYVFVPTIATDSSSSSAFTWPPTDFSVTIDCKALDASGATVWQTSVKGEGKAEFEQFKHDFSLSAKRASKDAFQKLQDQISTAAVFR